MKIKAPFEVVDYHGTWYLFAQRIFQTSTNIMGTHRGTMLQPEGKDLNSSILYKDAEANGGKP